VRLATEWRQELELAERPNGVNLNVLRLRTCDFPKQRSTGGTRQRPPCGPSDCWINLRIARESPVADTCTRSRLRVLVVGKRCAVFGGLTPNEHILRYPILAFYFIAAAVRSLSINTRFRSIPHLYPPSAPVPRMTR
jgi:hypothetical protein